MEEPFSQAFGIEKPDFIGFVYERYKHYIENNLRPKDKAEWEMIEETITYNRDDIPTF